MSRYERFNRQEVVLEPIQQRGHRLLASECSDPDPLTRRYEHPEFDKFVCDIGAARDRGRPIILMMGAHPIKLGLSPYIIELMRRGWVTHVATNGAGVIHDYELARLGGTSEDVAKWLPLGQFGLWDETSQINDIIVDAAQRDEGLGEAVGRTLVTAGHTTSELSICAAGWKLGIPVTCHVSIGSDIIHMHPNFDPAACGKATDTDFLILAHSVGRLSGGVLLNIGTAVTGPEVFLKALSMARNRARQLGRAIEDFSVGVFDLQPMAEPARCRGTAHPDTPEYYFRPWKTLLVRCTAGHGQTYYFEGDHRLTIPTLLSALTLLDEPTRA